MPTIKTVWPTPSVHLRWDKIMYSISFGKADVLLSSHVIHALANHKSLLNEVKQKINIGSICVANHCLSLCEAEAKMH